MCRSPHAGAIQIQDRTDFCLQMTKKTPKKPKNPPPPQKTNQNKTKQKRDKTKNEQLHYYCAKSLCFPKDGSLKSVDKKTISLKLQFHDLRLG